MYQNAQKMDFVTYLQLMFWFEDNQFGRFLIQYKHIGTHPGTNIRQTGFQYASDVHPGFIWTYTYVNLGIIRTTVAK